MRALLACLALVVLATACSSSPPTGDGGGTGDTDGSGTATTATTDDTGTGDSGVLEATIEVAGTLGESGVRFDPADPVVDVQISPELEAPLNGLLVGYDIEPIDANPDEPAHFFVPKELLGGAAPDEVIAALWDERTEQWILLPTESLQDGIQVWTPHFTNIGFGSIVDGAKWVGGGVVDGITWAGDKAIDGLKGLVKFVWDVGSKVASEIRDGLLALDTGLGGAASEPPTCLPSDAARPFEMSRQVDNDDDKVLTCHWTEGDTFHLRVTNNRPYGMTAIFDRTLADAAIKAWPNTDRFSADRLLTEAFDAVEDLIGQAYIPSGATTDITWNIEDHEEVNVRFEATLANAAIDPAAAILLSVTQADDIGLALIEDELKLVAAIDCFASYIDAMLKLNSADGILATIDAGFDIFTSAAACFAGIFGEAVKDLLGIGHELLKIIRNSVSLLSDSVVEGNAKVKVELQFVRDAQRDLVLLSAQGLAGYPFGSDFEQTVDFVTSLLGPPAKLTLDEGGACGAIGGCDLQARWDGLTLAGPFDANTVEFWAVSTTPEMADVFSLPGHESVVAARSQSSWPSPINSFVLADDGSWVLTFPSTNLEALTSAAIPAGDWSEVGPPLPADAAIVAVFADGDWQRRPATDSPEEAASCDAVPTYPSPLDRACSGGWAVSPNLAASNAAWHLYHSVDGEWTQLDVGLTCCRAGDIEITFDGLLKRNQVPTATAVKLCQAVGIPIDDTGTGCAEEVPISNPCGTLTASFLGLTSGFAISICSGRGQSIYIGESLETGDAISLPACRLGPTPTSPWIASSPEGYTYRIDGGRLQVLDPGGAILLNDPFVEEYPDHRGSPIEC